MRALVIGATDALGRCVTERLLARGEAVRVAVAPIAEDDLAHAERLEVVTVGAPERDAAALVAGVDAVYDLGTRLAEASAAFEALWSPSLDSSPAVLEAAVADPRVRRYLFLSSVAVYRPAPRRSRWPLREDAPLEAHGSEELERFGATKIDAERRLAAAARAREGLDVTILRTSSVYGPGVEWAARLVRGRPRRGGRRSEGEEATPMQWTHVDDLADAVVLAGRHPAAAGRTYNIAGGELFTQREVSRAADAACTPTQWPAVLPAMSGTLKYAIDRAREELGYTPRVPLAEGLAGIARGRRSGWW